MLGKLESSTASRSVTLNMSARNKGKAVEKPMAIVRFLVRVSVLGKSFLWWSRPTWLEECFSLDVVSPLQYELPRPFRHMRIFGCH